MWKAIVKQQDGWLMVLLQGPYQIEYHQATGMPLWLLNVDAADPCDHHVVMNKQASLFSWEQGLVLNHWADFRLVKDFQEKGNEILFFPGNHLNPPHYDAVFAMLWWRLFCSGIFGYVDQGFSELKSLAALSWFWAKEGEFLEQCKICESSD